MKFLRFKLSGKTAFFKKPNVNTYYYFTYTSIHKVALLGMFGAILGLAGYNERNNNREIKKIKEDFKYPEFYEKLKELKVAIVPTSDKDLKQAKGYITFDGYVNKKIQTFNNSVGYASYHTGGNLIVKEQWLENPVWEIYLKVDSKISEELAKRFMNYNFTYMPYLGKNDHYANIEEVSIINDGELINSSDVKSIYGLFKSDYFEINNNIDSDDGEDDDEDNDYNKIEWVFEEFLPVSLTESINQYQKEKFRATSLNVKCVNDYKEIYKINGLNIFFF